MAERDFKDADISDVPDPQLMLGAVTAEQPLSAFVECPEPSDFRSALEAVDFLATRGESFLPPIL
jgi:hypothetical protein